MATGLSFVGDRLFDAEEDAFRLEFRAWLDANPPPRAPLKVDLEYIARYRPWQAALARAGYGALHWPVEFGGAGFPVGHQIVQLEELSIAGVDHNILLNALHMVGPLLIALGTDAQRAAHLPRILRGEEVWSQMLSEPGAGSDLGGVSTRGVVDGDRLVLTGQKVWTTWGHFADYGLCLCRTGTGADRKAGALSLVMVDLRSPGLTIRPLRQMDGGAEFNEVFLEEVSVPLADVIGGVGNGWSALRVLLTAERTGLGFTGYVMLVAAVQRLFDGLRTTDPIDRQELARLWSGAAVHRLTALRAAGTLERPEVSFAPASVGKLQHTLNYRMLGYAGLRAVGSGGLAWSREDLDIADAVNFFLLGPGVSIGGGTSEVQKNAVAEAGLGLPRS